MFDYLQELSIAGHQFFGTFAEGAAGFLEQM
jgi:hypothetical protein